MKKEMMLLNGKILVTLILPLKFSHPYNKGNWVLFARQWTFVSVSWILFAIIQLVPFGLEIDCITQKYDLKPPSMKSALTKVKSLTVSDKLKQDTVAVFLGKDRTYRYEC